MSAILLLALPMPHPLKKWDLRKSRGGSLRRVPALRAPGSVGKRADPVAYRFELAASRALLLTSENPVCFPLSHAILMCVPTGFPCLGDSGNLHRHEARVAALVGAVGTRVRALSTAFRRAAELARNRKRPFRGFTILHMSRTGRSVTRLGEHCHANGS